MDGLIYKSSPISEKYSFVADYPNRLEMKTIYKELHFIIMSLKSRH